MAAVKGIAVPFTFTTSGYPAAATDVELINDSVFTILSTVVGERVYRPTFGCLLKQIIFAPLTRATAFRAQAEIRRALALWEKRIKVTQITFETPSENTILIHVAWILNGSITSKTTVPLILDTRA